MRCVQQPRSAVENETAIFLPRKRSNVAPAQSHTHSQSSDGRRPPRGFNPSLQLQGSFQCQLRLFKCKEESVASLRKFLSDVTCCGFPEQGVMIRERLFARGLRPLHEARRVLDVSKQK